MTNKDRQASLDKIKWLASEEVGEDASGYMTYCEHCEYQVNDPLYSECSIPHEQRVEKCACAKAYNRMVRNTNKTGN